jgi:thiosulfate/3-mercaptopyruvate sulfurtransferase
MAKCLPTPWLWTFAGGIGTYKSTDGLRAMASGIVGWPVFFKEIIVYCGVGGYASTMYFVLSEVHGYKNVKIYDGSAQEWTGKGMPVVLYR